MGLVFWSREKQPTGRTKDFANLKKEIEGVHKMFNDLKTKYRIVDSFKCETIQITAGVLNGNSCPLLESFREGVSLSYIQDCSETIITYESHCKLMALDDVPLICGLKRIHQKGVCGLFGGRSHAECEGQINQSGCI